MGEQAQWPDDNLIADLIYRMTKEYAALLQHEAENMELDLLNHPGSPMNVDTKLWVDATDFLVLSPPKIWDAFHGLMGVVGEGYNSDVNAKLTELTDSLSDWDGLAAQAFVNHVANIRGFVDAQRGYDEELLVGYVAAYKVAVQAREGFKSLVEDWIEVSRQYRAEDDERRRGVKIKVAVGILAAVGAAVTGGATLAALIGSASAVGGAVAEEVTADMGADNGVDVWRLYEKAYRRLAETNQQCMEEIRSSIRTADGRIPARVALDDPLPPITDVDSPDFRYENFYHDAVGGGYSRRVDDERKKRLDDDNASHFRANGPIALVLGGTPGRESRVDDV